MAAAAAAGPTGRVCILLEATHFMEQHWKDIRQCVLEPLLRGLASGSLPKAELLLVLFRAQAPAVYVPLEVTGWTADLTQFRQWLDVVDFQPAGMGGSNLAEAVAEALYHCQTGRQDQAPCQLLICLANEPARIAIPWPHDGDPMAMKFVAHEDMLIHSMQRGLAALTVAGPSSVPRRMIQLFCHLAHVTNETAAQHVVRFSSSAHVYIPPRWEPALKLLKAERDRIVPQPSQPQPSTSAGLPALSPADTSESRQGSQSQSQKLPKSPYNPGSPGGMQIPPAALEPRMQKLPGRLGPGRLGTQQSQQSQQGQHTSQHGQLQQQLQQPQHTSQHGQLQQQLQPQQMIQHSQPQQQLPPQRDTYGAGPNQSQQQQAQQAAQRMQHAQQQLTGPQQGTAPLHSRAATIDLTEAGITSAVPAPHYAGSLQLSPAGTATPQLGHAGAAYGGSAVEPHRPSAAPPSKPAGLPPASGPVFNPTPLADQAPAGPISNWQWSGWVCLAPALAGQSGTQPVVALMAKLVMEIKDQTLLARLPSPQQTYLVVQQVLKWEEVMAAVQKDRERLMRMHCHVDFERVESMGTSLLSELIKPRHCVAVIDALALDLVLLYNNPPPGADISSKLQPVMFAVPKGFFQGPAVP